MMLKTASGKILRLPTFHARGRDGDPVNSAGGIRDVTADFTEAVEPEKLARAVDRSFAFKTIFHRVPVFFRVSRAGDAERGVFGKFLQQKFKMIRPEGNVGIEVSDDFKFNVL